MCAVMMGFGSGLRGWAAREPPLRVVGMGIPSPLLSQDGRGGEREGDSARLLPRSILRWAQGERVGMDSGFRRNDEEEGEVVDGGVGVV